ncbi:MAG: galactitol-1-phosphate 5-dehydrogenase [Ruminococcus sp.]|jgi:L-iditol 2-dehydrogenase|nr:galactitol-1-phosphate 5-dehydrogenase [Ruminococcus sp.]
MKAWRLYGTGDIRFEDVPIPALNPSEVLVKVAAAGICSSDIGRVFGAGAYHYPITLGHEFAGVVADTADEKDRYLIGKRVGVFPLLPCFECESCKRESFETCKNYSYIGSRRDGAFAEYVNVPVWNLIPLPDNVNSQNAAMLEPTAVALHAVRLVDLSPEKSVSVIGNGAIGQLAAQFFSNTAPETTLLGRGDPDVSADITLEAVGTAQSLSRCIDITKPGGEIILMGNPPADFALSQKPYWQILRKQLKTRGSWNSSFRHNENDDWNSALSKISAGEISPSDFISHRFAFERLDEALFMMNERKVRHLKVMVECGE